MLEETLPRADRAGEFVNIGTYMSETSGKADWPTWKVNSSDGTLNCRVAPNGKVQRPQGVTRRLEQGLEVENSV